MSDRALHTLSVSSGVKGRVVVCGGGGVQVRVWMRRIIVDRGIPHFVYGVIRHQLNHGAFGVPLGAPRGGGQGAGGTDLWGLAVMDLSAERLFIRES